MNEKKRIQAIQHTLHYASCGGIVSEDFQTLKLTLEEAKDIFNKYQGGDGDEAGSLGFEIVSIKLDGFLIYSKERYLHADRNMLLDLIRQFEEKGKLYSKRTTTERIVDVAKLDYENQRQALKDIESARKMEIMAK